MLCEKESFSKETMSCGTDLWEKEVKEDLLESVPYLLKMPSTRIWIDYDDEADVLYISFPETAARGRERVEG
jgi:hypothetical protein